MTAGQTALVTLENLDFFASMFRSAGTYSDLTALSRSYLVQCRAGTPVRAVLTYGQLNSGPADYSPLTFLVLPYQPRLVSATSWAVYRSVVRRMVYLLKRSDGLQACKFRLHAL